MNLGYLRARAAFDAFSVNTMDTPDEKDVAIKSKRLEWDFQDKEDTHVTQHDRQQRTPLWECPVRLKVTNLEPTVRQPSKNWKPLVQRPNQKQHPLVQSGTTAYDDRILILVEAHLLNRGADRRATPVVLINDKVHEVACPESLQLRRKVTRRGETSAQDQGTTPTGVSSTYNVFCAYCAWAQKHSAA